MVGPAATGADGPRQSAIGTPAPAGPPAQTEEFAPPAHEDWMLGGVHGILPRARGEWIPRFPRGKPVDGRLAGRRLLLTFDDGPFPATTPGLLDILARERVPAVFFVIGYKIVDKTDQRVGRRIVRRMAAEGHVVANHSMNHPQMPRLPEARWKREVTDAHQALRSVVGYSPTLFRPPYGEINGAIDRWLTWRGYTRVLWRYSADEFRRLAAPAVARSILRKIRERERAGADVGGIVLLHDAYAASVDAAAILIRRIKAENCSLLEKGDEDIWRFVGFQPFFEPINGPPLADAGPPAATADEIEEARRWCRENHAELPRILAIDREEDQE